MKWNRISKQPSNLLKLFSLPDYDHVQPEAPRTRLWLGFDSVHMERLNKNVNIVPEQMKKMLKKWRYVLLTRMHALFTASFMWAHTYCRSIFNVGLTFVKRHQELAVSKSLCHPFIRTAELSSWAVARALNWIQTWSHSVSTKLPISQAAPRPSPPTPQTTLWF